MISLIFFLLYFYVIVKILQDPSWSVVGLFAFIICEKTSYEYIPFGVDFLLILNVITALSFILSHLIIKKSKIYLNNTIFIFLAIYVIYIAVSSFSTFYFDGTRSWALTYIQSLIMVIVISNTIRNFSQLYNIMLWFIIFGFFATFVYFMKMGSSIFEQEIEGSNTYGRLFLILIIFSYSFYKGGVQNRILRYGSMFLIIYFLFALFLCSSRTSQLILFFLIFYYGIKDYRLNLFYLVGLFSVATILFFLLPEVFVFKILRSFDDSSFQNGSGDTEYNSIGSNVRLLLWNACFDMLNDSSWLLGIGVGNYRYLMPQYIPFLNTPVSHPHNSYFSVLVESGIIGLILFLYFNYLTLKSFFTFRNLSNNQNRRILEAWFLSFVVFLIGGLTKHDHYDKLLFLFIGLASSLKNFKHKYENFVSY